jgi:hypothetical protein
MRRMTFCAGPGVVLALLATNLLAQAPREVAAERAGYLRWLKTAPNSPLFAVAQQPVGTALRLGPEDADIPLAGIGEHKVTAEGTSLTLEGPSGKQPIAPGRPTRLGDYTLYSSGSPTGPILTVFGSTAGKEPPGYYPYDGSLVFVGPLLPPEHPGKARVLGANGIEVEATEAGSVLLPVGGTTRLRVLRIPIGGEESELEVFFRDSTNGEGTYPAGRFVSLVPVGAGKVRLDLNRARNPFCAYSSVYPCPAPWRGNELGAAVRAGERYEQKDPTAEPAKQEGT